MYIERLFSSEYSRYKKYFSRLRSPYGMLNVSEVKRCVTIVTK